VDTLEPLFTTTGTATGGQNCRRWPRRRTRRPAPTRTPRAAPSPSPSRSWAA